GSMGDAGGRGGVADLGLATMGRGGVPSGAQERLRGGADAMLVAEGEPTRRAVGGLDVCRAGAFGLPSLEPVSRVALAATPLARTRPAMVAEHALASLPPGTLATGGISGGSLRIPQQLARNSMAEAGPLECRPGFHAWVTASHSPCRTPISQTPGIEHVVGPQGLQAGCFVDRQRGLHLEVVRGASASP